MRMDKSFARRGQLGLAWREAVRAWVEPRLECSRRIHLAQAWQRGSACAVRQKSCQRSGKGFGKPYGRPIAIGTIDKDRDALLSQGGFKRNEGRVTKEKSQAARHRVGIAADGIHPAGAQHAGKGYL